MSELTDAPPTARSTGLLLIITAIVMVAFMATHPTVHHHDPEGFIAEVGRIATLNAVVHGSLIAVLCTLTVGMWGLAHRLWFGFLPVRLGCAAYTLGTAFLTLPALINGFVIGAFIERYAPDAAATQNQWRPVLELCHEFSHILSQAGVIGMSAGTLLWSIVLAHRPGAARLLGALGALCSVVPLALLFVGRLPMNVHGFGLFVLMQGVFGVAVGVQLLRARI